MCKHLHIVTECLLQINLGEKVLKDLAHQFYINYIKLMCQIYSSWYFIKRGKMYYSIDFM